MYKVCIQKEGLQNKPIYFKLQQGIEKVDDEIQYVTTDEDNFLPLDKSLNNSLKAASNVKKRMEDLSKSGIDQELLTQSIGSTIIILGLIAIGMVVISAFLQVKYLKTFFKQRKML